MYPETIARSYDSVTEPITLAEAKNFLRVTSSADDDYIGHIISTARGVVEKLTGRALVTQTVTYGFKRFPIVYKQMHLPIGKTTAITSVSYRNITDGNTTVPSDQYFLDNKADGVSYIGFNETFSMPTIDIDYELPIEVVATCTVTDILPALKQAMYLMIGNYYEMRVPISLGSAPFKVPLSVEHILSQYKIRQKV